MCSFKYSSDDAYAMFAVPETLAPAELDAEGLDEMPEAADEEDEEEELQPTAAASPMHAMPSSAAPLARARRDDRKMSIP
jgi:hypothetical protein